MRCLCTASDSRDPSDSRIGEFREGSVSSSPKLRTRVRPCVAHRRDAALELGAFGYPMAALYLHYEEASPEFTMKCAATAPTRAPPPKPAPPRSAATRPPGRLPLAAGPSAAEALVQFAAAYAKKTGRTLQVSALRMSTERGRTLEPTAVLPCGIPSGSDLFVGGAQPVLAPGATDAPVYAKEGSKVAASQGKMGENSYYYRLGDVRVRVRDRVRVWVRVRVKP